MLYKHSFYAILNKIVNKMKRLPASEKLLIEEVTHIARKTKEISKGLPSGTLIKMIRIQVGMSQQVLAKRVEGQYQLRPPYNPHPYLRNRMRQLMITVT